MKYTEEVKERIYELYATGEYTIKQICAIVDINKDTWYSWKNEKPDFSDLLKEAGAEKYENMRVMSTGGAKKLLLGYKYDEITKELKKTDNGDELVEVKRVTKTVSPNPTSVIFVLTNQDSENFKHKQSLEIKDTTKQPQTKEEILERLKQLDEEERNIDKARGKGKNTRGKGKA